MSDLIDRQAAIDALDGEITVTGRANAEAVRGYARLVADRLKRLPSVQPEIIRCNSCKYWTQTTGKMKDYGLGRCDFHDADLVACNGFCYWAERRTDG